MKKEVREIKSCRVCGFKPLTAVLSLGDVCVSDFVDYDSKKTKKFPLELVLCNKQEGGCGLLQLKHTVSKEILYQNYWYRSGVNRTMTEELYGIARKAESFVDLRAGDFVLDIGTNDGTLLRGYKTKGLNLIGFEPAVNLIKYAREGTTKIINDFFNFAAWSKEFGNAKAKVITAIAMFYDLDDPNTFVADVLKCLHPGGILIIQMNYLPSMLSQNAFDNICHEHLEYYSLLSLEYLLNKHNLEVFDVELNDINGGSFRVYIRHKAGGTIVKIPKDALGRVQELREREEKMGLDKKEKYERFAQRIYNLRDELVTFVKTVVSQGKKVYIYGASTRGNTLLQFCNLDFNLIKAAAERNPDKWGRKTVGTLILIISEEQARAERPDYFLVIPWHFLPEFIEREAEFLKAGGKFIVPLPNFRIIHDTRAA